MLKTNKAFYGNRLKNDPTPKLRQTSQQQAGSCGISTPVQGGEKESSRAAKANSKETKLLRGDHEVTIATKFATQTRGMYEDRK